MIPEDVIAEIRSRVDIVAVIGQHVQLRKAGRNFKGLCPFHGEKTPSFNVAPDKGFFYCFGCQKKGDAFTFLMELEGKSFAEAAEQLAARAGIVITRQDESPEQRRARGERSAMLDVCKAAAEIFRGNLRDEKRGVTARAYLESRGVGEAISERFMLGYAAAEWSNMFDALRNKRYDAELAVKLGLIARRPSSSGYYDRFRDRLVCPVIVPGGDVVGFSARTLPPSAPPSSPLVPDPRGEPPKYINSPESLVYKKSRLLFGLAQAREGMAQKGRAVLVEGNFDAITFHQAGITETVAPLGTALTAEQVETLRRSAEEVVICYDGDRAGRTATRAALELLVAADIPVRVVALPDGEDPDSMVRKHGPARALELVTRAIGGVEYFCFEVWGKARDSADAHARALDDAARLITKVANETKRDLIVGTLASAMNVDVQVVRNAVARQENGGRQGQGGSAGGSRGASRPTHPSHPNAPHASDRSNDRYGGDRSGGGSSGRWEDRGGGSGGGGFDRSRSSGRWEDRGGSGGGGFDRSRSSGSSGTSGSSGRWEGRQGSGSSGGSSRFGGDRSGSGSGNRFGGDRSGSGSGNRFGDRNGDRSGSRFGGSNDRSGNRFGPGRFGDQGNRSFDRGGDRPFDPGDRSDDFGPPGWQDDRGAPPDDRFDGPPSSSHPNAPAAPSGGEAGAVVDGRGPSRYNGGGGKPSLPPIEEVELFALLYDHPALLATSDADRAFSLLTDGRLRDMYSAAREGQSLLELAHALLPQPTADLVLSGKYAAAVDPRARFVALTDHLVRRAADVGLRSLGQRLAEAKRSGDHEAERRLVAEIMSTRKQVD